MTPVEFLGAVEPSGVVGKVLDDIFIGDTRWLSIGNGDDSSDSDRLKY